MCTVKYPISSKENIDIVEKPHSSSWPLRKGRAAQLRSCRHWLEGRHIVDFNHYLLDHLNLPAGEDTAGYTLATRISKQNLRRYVRRFRIHLRHRNTDVTVKVGGIAVRASLVCSRGLVACIFWNSSSASRRRTVVVAGGSKKLADVKSRSNTQRRILTLCQ